MGAGNDSSHSLAALLPLGDGYTLNLPGTLLGENAFLSSRPLFVAPDRCSLHSVAWFFDPPITAGDVGIAVRRNAVSVWSFTLNAASPQQGVERYTGATRLAPGDFVDLVWFTAGLLPAGSVDLHVAFCAVPNYGRFNG